jgi:hypothetical protein
MSGQAEILERTWRRLAGPVETGDRGSVEGVLKEPAAMAVVGELRMAAGLRGAMAAVRTPDVDVEWARLVRHLEAPATPVLSVTAVRGLRRPRQWARIAVTAAVAGGTLAGLSMSAAGAAPGSVLYPFRKVIEKAALLVSPRDAGVRLEIAEARLDDLVGALDHREFRLAPRLGRDLVEARRAAQRSGADVSGLDREIAVRIPRALASAPAATADSVRGILGSLLPPASSIRAPGAPPQTGTSPSPGQPSTGPSPGESSDDPGGSASASDSDDQEGSSGDQQDERSTDDGDREGSESDAGDGGGTSNGDEEASGGSSGDQDSQGNDSGDEDSQGNDSTGGENGQGGGNGSAGFG